MSLIKIYLRDLGKVNYNAGAVRVQLEELFKKVCEHPTATIRDSSVLWWSHNNPFPPKNPFPPLQPHDIAVYILRSRSKSVIKRVCGYVPSQSDAGSTYFGGSVGTISEVYLEHEVNKTSRGLSNMIFHEFMHNKLQIGSGLHTLCGAGTSSLATGYIRTSGIRKNELEICDIQLMAPVLGNHVRQYIPP